ncbi:3-oxo-5alpha-steroid 4-dehydrogenase [Saccharopolyspora kobensis]|uniref:3-oxo-5alpha-steroid 4-dehydrogenase n=1 Tax=Saccharopolyspora kobensis TaxID=146035 RepID=A0A1H6EFJ1_9PSEU|nr:FAD-binding protein [Saccharopolyspora kobensis]SEG96542.1 3-oxo-5alpha-steroid 4-dehydrogenase [Saccharopolyspora kobensis]SFF06328.1 3-oxo-5alpha-steroid 4-dehydrogenase [Saccharopolyspora kobensis]
MAQRSTLHADVVIIGFGAAGACAALEAAHAGARVVVLDRFGGGGASALSGGVVYAGGGTREQRAAGVPDSPEAMFAYLRQEVGDAVSADTLRRFCEGSTEMITWLAQHGVPFEGSLCPYKTSYPSNRHYLYYSGSEAAGGFRDAAPPAPRGHRAKGRGTSGKVLFAALEAAVRRAGVQVLTQTRAKELVVDADGRVCAVDCERLTGSAARAHRAVSRVAAKPGLYVPKLARRLHRRAERLERRAEPLRIHADRAVVIAAGGFVSNREMMRRHAPAYRAGLPLGTQGDDGSGIRLGESVGGVAAKLDHVSAWRFITPPSALLSGLLVDRHGTRIGDESRYGAAHGQAIVDEHGGRAWLLVDSRLRSAAKRQIRTQTVWFQRMQAEYLFATAATGGTLEAAARKAGVDPEALKATVDAHNEAARDGKPDPAGKPADFVQVLDQPPYALLDVSVRPSTAYPCPVLTLGGLLVDEDTGQVLDERGGPVAGLFAAGRSAVGICSNSYISGLSLADCVFSGRRAGLHSVKELTDADR